MKTKKTSATKAATNTVREVVPFDNRKVDITKFKPDLSDKDIIAALKLSDALIIPPFFFLPIETLTPAKTLGRGRTNLTLIMPTIMQVDATTPYASFDMSVAPSRNPTVQIHFEPSAYGITSVASYLIGFSIQTWGSTTFNLAAYAGPGSTVVYGGTKTVNGQVGVTMLLENVSPSQQTYAYIEQTAGASWSWYSTQVRFPPLVLQP